MNTFVLVRSGELRGLWCLGSSSLEWNPYTRRIPAGFHGASVLTSGS